MFTFSKSSSTLTRRVGSSGFTRRRGNERGKVDSRTNLAEEFSLALEPDRSMMCFRRGILRSFHFCDGKIIF